MRVIVTLIAALFLSTPASAAEFAFLSSKENSNWSAKAPTCTFRLSGLIEKGDADNFARFYRRRNIDEHEMRKVFMPVLCLDSPGGSFSEAVQFINFLDKAVIGTYVEDGARCESACALVFMAGSYPEEGNTYSWRMMHPGAKLGFHAPDLTLAPGQYNEADVSKAYRIALKSVSATVEKLVMSSIEGERRMAPSLLSAMLATPSDEMHYVDTVDKAGRWGIRVVPVGKPRRYSEEALVRACGNMRSWDIDESAFFDGTPRYEGSVKGSDYSLQTSGDTMRMLFFGMYVEGCEFQMNEKPQRISDFKIRISAVDDVGTVDFLGLSQALDFFHPATPLEKLR